MKIIVYPLSILLLLALLLVIRALEPGIFGAFGAMLVMFSFVYMTLVHFRIIRRAWNGDGK